MKMFHIVPGTAGVALRNGAAMVEQDRIVTTREATYDLEDVVVDPLGRHSPTSGPTLGADYARRGWYGFRLPPNRRGYTTLLVPGSDVTIL